MLQKQGCQYWIQIYKKADLKLFSSSLNLCQTNANVYI